MKPVLLILSLVATVLGQPLMVNDPAFVAAIRPTPRSGGVGGGGSGHTATTFIGGGAYLDRGSNMTGDADSTNWTFSIWCNFNALGWAHGNLALLSNDSADVSLNLVLTAGEGYVDLIYDSITPPAYAEIRSSTNTASFWTNNWHSILFSFTTDDLNSAALFVDDVKSTYVSDNTLVAGSTINFTSSSTNWRIGNDSNGDFLEGCLSEVWDGHGVYLDFTQTANRRKFISADLKPVDLGADGSTPTGSAPILYLPMDPAAPGINKGTGGNFTVTGSTSSCTPP